MNEESVPQGATRTIEPSTSQVLGNHQFPVVGIGASAGGIGALKQFFTEMPADSGMAFVVILHLSDQHESILAEIIQTKTAMPVAQVTETIKVEPNHVYVIPPAKHLELMDGVIKLKEPEHLKGNRVPIDLFFRSLADAYGRDAVSIILSGTGSDGTMGLKRVKEFGGFVFAQSPEDAEYDGMPLSAINTGLVDMILPVAEIPGKLMRLGKLVKPFEIPEEQKDLAEKPTRKIEPDALREVLTLLRVRTGHDFMNYKRPTMLRRIARRLQVQELEDIPAYLVLLRESPEEVQQLLRDLLITVTNFFRDQEAFAALEQEVIPQLFVGKISADTVRVWVAGSATGEEAYSLAMLLCEHAARLTDAPKIQIFASDINEEAIRAARDCRYDETIAADVSPERLRRFFDKEGNTYCIKKELREMVLFAPHNLLRDPPFSRLDLVTCRNLLIYFNRETQERVLEIFNFALRNNGFLFLGSSETAESQTALFIPVDKKHRIYRCRLGMAHHPLPIMPIQGKWVVKIPEAQVAEYELAGSFAATHLKLVEQYAPPSVLVNEDHDIVHSSEHAGRFLRFAGGEPSRNLLKLVHPALQLDLRSALMAAKQAGGPIEARGIRCGLEGAERLVNLIVRPSEAGFLLVIFEEEKDAPVAREEGFIADAIAGDKAMETVVRGLEEELRTTKDRLRSTLEQSETSTEELKASNEELQAINEELRSASEELETSKEELQSINEELTTVNHELKDKVDEAGRANSDLQNLMQSTDIATIFLDRALQIKRFTPRATELFNVIPSDLGRPLEHITHKLDYAFLVNDAAEVLQTLHLKEREVRGGKQDSRYLVRLSPYRTIDDRIDGVVLSFQDITELKRTSDDLSESEEHYRTLFDLGPVAIYSCDSAGVIQNFNRRARELWGREPALGDTEERFCGSFKLFRPDGSFMPHAQCPMAEVLSGKRSEARDEEVLIERPDGSRVTVVVNIRPLNGQGGKVTGAVNCFYDITERKQMEKAVQESEEKYRMVFNTIDEGFCIIEMMFDANGKPHDYRFLEFNSVFEKLTGLENAAGKTAFELVPDLEDFWIQIYGSVALTGKTVRFENYSESMNRWFDVYASRIGDDAGCKVALVFSNITERKRTEDQLRSSEEFNRTVLESSPDCVKIIDEAGRLQYMNANGLCLLEIDDFVPFKNEFWWNMWALETQPVIKESVAKALRGETTQFQAFCPTAKGTPKWWDVIVSPISGADGKPARLISVSRDITESKQVEEALKDGDRRKDEFLATLAHELRNPLAPIRSALEVMRRADSKEQDQQAREIIERQLLQIIRLVDDLLDISRITQGKINLLTETVELRRVIEMALETVRPAINAAGHTLEVSLPDEPVYLDADETRLTQVFLNLLTNSARYTDPGGKISIEAEFGENQVGVCIRDTGQGISPELLPHVFDLFTQGSPARKSGQGGLGIGLSLVKRLTEMHGGTVEAHSDGLGTGSKFIIRLPLATEQKREQKKKQVVEETSPVNGESSPRKILVVDDNVDSAKMMEVVLTMDGHKVRVAYNGQTAVDIALEFQPDLMFLDLGLPDIDGYEVAARIRGQLPNTLLVALSGWGQESDRRRTREAGFDRHLVKPLNFDELPALLAAAGRNRISSTET